MIGPQAYLGSEAPVYITAKRVMVGTFVLTVVSQILLLGIYMWRNKKKQIISEDYDDTNAQLSFGDMTDVKNPQFIYTI